MIIGIPKETKFKENRVAITPLIAKDLIKQGFTVHVESGAGLNSFFSDDNYKEAGATLSDKNTTYQADIVLKVYAPLPEEIALMKKDAVLISFMWAATNPELVSACEKAGISAFSMDAVPRI